MVASHALVVGCASHACVALAAAPTAAPHRPICLRSPPESTPTARLSCGFYMACSAGMMIINKMVLRVRGRASSKHLPIALATQRHTLGSRAAAGQALPLPMTVVMIQMATTVIWLCVTSTTLHFGSVRDLMRWALSIPILFTFMLASSMLALDLASMGAIVVFRNIAPLITLAIERALQEKIELDVATILAMATIVGGVLLYALNDINFSALGLACVTFNMIASVVERVLQRKMIAVDPIDVSKTGELPSRQKSWPRLRCRHTGWAWVFYASPF